jgi:hypothetical protein
MCFDLTFPGSVSLQSSLQVPPAMKSTLLPLAAAAALFIGLSAPAAAEVSLGSAGGWNITANDTVCAGSMIFDNGTALGFGIYADGRGAIIIKNKNWNIPKGNYPVVSSIDRTKPTTFNAQGNGQSVVWAWEINEDEINLVSNGAVLRATIGRAEYSYRLNGSAEMLRAVRRCAVSRLSIGNPFSRGAAAEEAPSDNPFPETASNPYRRM